MIQTKCISHLPVIIKQKKNSVLGQSIFVEIRPPPLILWHLVRRVRLFVLFVVFMFTSIRIYQDINVSKCERQKADEYSQFHTSLTKRKRKTHLFAGTYTYLQKRNLDCACLILSSTQTKIRTQIPRAKNHFCAGFKQIQSFDHRI